MTRKNNSLSLRAIEGEIIPEEETYQACLRQAMFDGITESDVKELVASIVAKAKSGDEKATRLLFDYVLGAKTKPTAIHVTNHFQSVDQAANIRKHGS